MLETPYNFEEDWSMMPVPIGKRCLVVAYRGVSTWKLNVFYISQVDQYFG